MICCLFFFFSLIASSNLELITNAHIWKRKDMWYFKMQNFWKKILDCFLDLKLKYHERHCILNVFHFFFFFLRGKINWSKETKKKTPVLLAFKTFLTSFLHRKSWYSVQHFFILNVTERILSFLTTCWPFQIMFISGRSKNQKKKCPQTVSGIYVDI